jgi:hypothetical protein
VCVWLGEGGARKQVFLQLLSSEELWRDGLLGTEVKATSFLLLFSNSKMWIGELKTKNTLQQTVKLITGRHR